MNLELSISQASLLRDLLQEVLADLGMEIAATDSHDFRDRLKDRREVLQQLFGSLEKKLESGPEDAGGATPPSYPAGREYKPDGYTTVSPYLIVSGASRTIDFLIQAFDGVELRRYADPTGGIMHAEVQLDDTVVMLADGAEGWPPHESYVHVYVPDVDATYRRALEAGAISVQEPVKKADDDKRGGVKDSGGTTWWIGTRMA